MRTPQCYFSLLLGDAAECDDRRSTRPPASCATACSSACTIHTVPTLHFQFDRTTERARRRSSAADRRAPTPTRANGRLMNLARPRIARRRPSARRAAARQAAGPVEQRRLAEGQAAAARREGRPHRHARPAGHRPAAAVFRRRHQVLAGQPGRRQDATRATLRLGQTTTHRRRAKASIVAGARRWPSTRAAIDAACRRFTGAIDQMPPMHSALKNEGRALYEYARAGIEVERAPRRVVDPPHRRARLAGRRRWSLRRRAAARAPTSARWPPTSARRWAAAPTWRALAPHRQRPARRRRRRITLDSLPALGEAERDARLLPADVLLADWPALRLPDDEAGRFLTGLRRRVRAGPTAPRVRVYGPEPQRLAWRSAHIAAGELIADRLLSPAEMQRPPGFLNSPRP